MTTQPTLTMRTDRTQIDWDEHEALFASFALPSRTKESKGRAGEGRLGDGTLDGTAVESSRVSPTVPPKPQNIVWYLGGRNSYGWEPEQTHLGGSEQAVGELSSAWASRGITVAVYGQFRQSRVHRGVAYRDVRTFRNDLLYENLIIWRALGADIFNRKLTSDTPYDKLKAHRLIYDVHDNFLYPSIRDNLDPLSTPLSPEESARFVAEKFDKVMVRSRFHAEYMNLTKYDPVIIANGVRIDALKIYDDTHG